MKWVVNRDEALVLMRDGVGIAGIWRGCWKTGERHVPKKSTVAALAMIGAVSGASLPIGPHDIVARGFIAAVWNPYRRIGRFLTVKEAKKAVEKEA